MNLKNAIDDYLKNRFINYALLIKGEWGSGKTFFVKKNVVKRYNNALYISLYGISSIDKFSEKIYLEMLRSKATTNCVSKLFRNDLVLKVKKVQDPMLKYPFKLLLEKVDYVISRLDA